MPDPIPVVLLGRLAIDKQWQKKSIGRALFQDAVMRVLRTPDFSIGPSDTFALWSRGSVDPLVHRVLRLLKEIKTEL